jgi:hypothetical protein
LLWHLVKNGILEKGAVLSGNEPETNINPKYIPILAEMLLELQIFISTHDSVLAKYLEINQKLEHKLPYHAFYVENQEICFEAGLFSVLKHKFWMAFLRFADVIYSITAGINAHG